MSILGLAACIEWCGTMQGRVSVIFDRYDGERVQYKWEVTDENLNVLGEGDDLRSGSGEDVNYPKMLAALCGFLAACGEAQRYPDSDNRDLFPPAVAEWAEANQDGLSMASEELDPQG